MARTSLIEDIFEMLRKPPWWLGVSAAAAFWIAGALVTARAASAPIRNAVRPLIPPA